MHERVCMCVGALVRSHEHDRLRLSVSGWALGGGGGGEWGRGERGPEVGGTSLGM